MTDEIKTGAIPNCQCHQRIAQLESVLEILAEFISDCARPPDANCPSHLECAQCWIERAMEEAKK